MVWLELHGVARQKAAGGRWRHDSSSIKDLLNFAYDEYEAGAYTRSPVSST